MELGVLIAAGGLIISFLMYQLNRTRDVKTDSKESAKDNARFETKLEYISKGVDEIRIDLKANEKQIAAFGERLAHVEESAKQAHKRINNLEGGEHG